MRQVWARLCVSTNALIFLFLGEHYRACVPGVCLTSVSDGVCAGCVGDAGIVRYIDASQLNRNVQQLHQQQVPLEIRRLACLYCRRVVNEPLFEAVLASDGRACPDAQGALAGAGSSHPTASAAGISPLAF